MYTARTHSERKADFNANERSTFYDSAIFDGKDMITAAHVILERIAIS